MQTFLLIIFIKKFLANVVQFQDISIFLEAVLLHWLDSVQVGSAVYVVTRIVDRRSIFYEVKFKVS